MKDTVENTARLAPVCEVLDACGGCTLQEMDYQAQLEVKRAALRSLATELSTADLAEQVSVFGLQDPLGYRCRLMMPASSRSGRLRFGFYRRQTLELVAAESCPVQHAITRGALNELQEFLEGHGVQASDAEGKRGWLHAVAIRCNPDNGQWDLVLMANKAKPGLTQKLASLPGLVGASQITYRKRSSYPFSGSVEPLFGSKRLVVSFAGTHFGVSAASFFQTAMPGAELLVRLVRDLYPNKVERFADLYGGVGLFSRLLASSWKHALLIEQGTSSIDDLTEGLKAEPLPGLRWINGAVEDELEALRKFAPNVVLLDPPRKGVKRSVLEFLLELQDATVIYVACGAEAFARDAKILLDGGYRLTALHGVDMFPHTNHVEIVGAFSR